MAKRYIYRQIEVYIGSSEGAGVCWKAPPEYMIDQIRHTYALDAEWRLAHVVPYNRNMPGEKAQWALYIFEQVVE